MQMIVLLLEQHIRHGQYHSCTQEVHLMRQDIIRTHIDEAQRHHQLQGHIQQAHLHVTNLQFVSHQLISTLPVRLIQVLVQHDAVADGQYTIHTIHQQEDQICQIVCSNNHLANRLI